MTGYSTPEEAALAGWALTPAAQARVVAVEPCTEPEFPGRVWVFIDTVPSHLMRSACELVDGLWFEVGDVSA